MYTRESKFKTIYERFVSENACADPNVFFNPLISHNPDITFGEAMDKFLLDDRARDAWAIWAFRTIGYECDSILRKEMLSKIKSPMKALKLFERYHKELTTKEKNILKNVFVGKKPNAERELKDRGII